MKILINKILNEQIMIPGPGVTLNTVMNDLYSNIQDIISANYLKYIDKYNNNFINSEIIHSIDNIGSSSSRSSRSSDSSSNKSQSRIDNNNNDDLIKAVSYRVRLELSSILLPFYQSLLTMLVTTQQDSFNKQILRIPSTIQLPKQVKLVSKKTSKIFNSNLQLLRTGIVIIIINHIIIIYHIILSSESLSSPLFFFLL